MDDLSDFKTQEFTIPDEVRELRPPQSSGQEPTPAEAEEALAWLWCDPLPPVPVGGKQVLLLGRSRDCDMILPHTSVSRKHATVTAVDGMMVLKNRSAYGTLVNGEKVDNKMLTSGDLIAIGPYLIQVSDTRTRHKLGEEATQPLKLPDDQVALSGRLERVPVSELLQQLEFNQRTGTLKVFDEARRSHGVLVVREGRPLHAKLGPHVGPEAALELLEISAGKFSFAEAISSEESTLEGLTLTGLMLEARRRSDEQEQPSA